MSGPKAPDPPCHEASGESVLVSIPPDCEHRGLFRGTKGRETYVYGVPWGTACVLPCAQSWGVLGELWLGVTHLQGLLSFTATYPPLRAGQGYLTFPGGNSGETESPRLPFTHSAAGLHRLLSSDLVWRTIHSLFERLKSTLCKTEFNLSSA